MRQIRQVLGAAALTLAAATPAWSQITITPSVGGYIPASDVNQIQGSAENIARTREGTLALGLNIELGGLRGSLAYASGTTIKNANQQEIGNGNVLAGAVDLVLRPLPRIFVQPYLLAGAGQKIYTYDGGTIADNADDRDFTWHGGIGADLALGPLAVMAEVTDFVSKGADGKWNVHDAFLLVGVKLRLGR